MMIKNDLIRISNAYEKLDPQMYLRIYIFCVHPVFEKKGVGYSLLEACNKLAINMKVI